RRAVVEPPCAAASSNASPAPARLAFTTCDCWYSFSHQRGNQAGTRPASVRKEGWVGVLSIEQVLAAEADAIHGVARGSVTEALQAHPSVQSSQSRRARKDADVRSDSDEERNDVEVTKAFYRSLNRLNRAALCLSGGGIRSATFCLGVIQALAMASERARTDAAGSGRSTDIAEDPADRSLLSRFHYLSTVSGGGYIGSWLSAWRKRDDFPTVWRNLTDRPEGPDIEPPQISWLRAYSNYLTPTIGIFSADSWTGA